MNMQPEGENDDSSHLMESITFRYNNKESITYSYRVSTPYPDDTKNESMPKVEEKQLSSFMIMIIIAVILCLFISLAAFAYIHVIHGKHQQNIMNESQHKEINELQYKMNETKTRMNNNELIINQYIDMIQEWKESINQFNESMNEQIELMMDGLFKLKQRINTFEAIKDHYDIITSKPNHIEAIINMPPMIQSNNFPLNESNHIFNTIQRGFYILNDILIGNNLYINNPQKLINSDSPYTLNYHDYLQFNARNNWLELKLSNSVIPKEFIYIHIDKKIITENQQKMAPKRFELFAKQQIENNDWRKIDIVNNRDMLLNQSMISLQLNEKIPIKFIRIKYDTNTGSKITRLYRFRIHGNIAN